MALVRAGCVLRPAPAAGAAMLSAPDREVSIQRAVAIPMRDGLSLLTDIYRPVGLERAPVVLVRTPYRRQLCELQAMYYARRGYVYAAQDCRGCFDSPGEWEPFVHEGRDGFDTIEWLAAQSWTDGRVGMIGGSCLGLAQWLAAAERPPHLVTIIPNVSPTDPFYNLPYEYGVFCLLGTLWWAEVMETRAGADISGVALSRVGQKRYLTLLRALPVVDLDVATLGHANACWRRWIEHPTEDAYWQSACFLERLAHVDIPVFHQSGWHDDNGLGTKLNYQRMAASGHGFQKLTLGPWGHTDTAVRMVGDRDFGEGALLDLPREYLRWFDRWLKGAVHEYRQRMAAERMDNLIYDTEPLTEALTFAGPISAVLYASTTARDTDWFLTLSEITADGTIRRLVQGRLRARFRNSMKAPELLVADAVFACAIDLWHTGVSLPPGSRLRLEVASAAFPMFSRNLNTGGHNETDTAYVSARQTVYHDAARPSHIVLP